MARIQILELPSGAADDRPPFALVIDQYQPRRYMLGPDTSEPVNEFAGVAEKIGASAILVFDNETVDIPANNLAPALLFRGDDYALTEMTRSRDEWQQRSIRTEETLERVRGEQHQAKVDLGVALSVSRLGGWNDIIAAARTMSSADDRRREIVTAIHELHRAVEHRGQIICAHCSALDDKGSTDNAPIGHPCATVQALDARPEAEAQPEDGEQCQ